MNLSRGEGDRAAFEDAYRETYSKTLAYVLRRTVDLEDAHDVVAETYTVAWRRVKTFLGTDKPQAWLYGVARKQMHNRWRSKRRLLLLREKAQGTWPTEPAPVDPSWSAEKRDEYELVWTAMSRLPTKDQEVLRLAAFEELSHEEIGVVLNTPVRRVRSMLYRARERLNVELAMAEQRQEGESGHKPSEGQRNEPDQDTHR